MKEANDQLQQTFQLLRTRGIMRPRELKAAGIPESYLWELAKENKIQQLGRGLYALNELELSAFHSLVEVSQYVPKGVICLLSALQFHELTTQLPPAVWLAIPAHAHRPQIQNLTLELVHIKPDLMTIDVETHIIERTSVRIFNPARTLADCFKFRGRVGMDVALEALRLGLEKGVRSEDIWLSAKRLRVSQIILPYLEALA